MRVEGDARRRRQPLARMADGLVDDRRGGGAAGVLVTKRVEGDVGREEVLEHLGVKRRVVRAGAAGRERHQRDADFVFQPVPRDRAGGVDQIVNIVERVEIPNRRDAVFFEELRVQVDDVARLGIERHDVDAARERLEVRIGTGRGAKGVHHREGVLVAVEIQTLKTRAAARLEVPDTGLARRLHRRQKVRREHTGAISALKAVTEGRDHHIDFFTGHGRGSRRCGCAVWNVAEARGAFGIRKVERSGSGERFRFRWLSRLRLSRSRRSRPLARAGPRPAR